MKESRNAEIQQDDKGNREQAEVAEYLLDELYAGRISDCDSTGDINVLCQKQQIIASNTANTSATAKNDEEEVPCCGLALDTAIW